jgi:hypothetical protein
MTPIHTRTRDWILVAFGIAAGLAATLGVTRYQMDWNDKFFASNALFYGISQIGVLIVLIPFRPRAISVAGVSLVNACYLVLFNAWVFSARHPDGGTWGIYFIALCVEAACVVKSVRWIRSRNIVSPLKVGAVTTGFALAGILIVHGFFACVVLLSTVP